MEDVFHKMNEICKKCPRRRGGEKNKKTVIGLKAIKLIPERGGDREKTIKS